MNVSALHVRCCDIPSKTRRARWIAELAVALLVGRKVAFRCGDGSFVMLGLVPGGRVVLIASKAVPTSFDSAFDAILEACELVSREDVTERFASGVRQRSCPQQELTGSVRSADRPRALVGVGRRILDP